MGSAVYKQLKVSFKLKSEFEVKVHFHHDETKAEELLFSDQITTDEPPRKKRKYAEDPVVNSATLILQNVHGMSKDRFSK